MKSCKKHRFGAALLAASLFISAPISVLAEGSDEHGYIVTPAEQEAKEELEAAQKAYDAAKAAEEEAAAKAKETYLYL